jgi:hypothetical protein
MQTLSGRIKPVGRALEVTASSVMTINEIAKP